MDELKLEVFSLGNLCTNSYLVFDPTQKKGFIVDAPCGIEEVSRFSRQREIDILFVAITHGHFDHIAGLDSLKYPFSMDPLDVPFLMDERLNGSLYFDELVTITKKPLLYPNKPIVFGKHTLEIIPTPGHTPGSVSLKLGAWLFSGDAIFCDAIGRTDIPLASQKTLLHSIKNRVLTLPGETLIYPGHGSSTTVAHERDHNPFLTHV